jgi:Zn-dependent peptidase ImmA (M78 family)
MEDPNCKARMIFARQAAKKLLADVGITTPPVLIRELVEYIKKERDLSIYPWAFSKNTDGVQVKEGEAVTIAYNEKQHPHRQRFTVAHEIGHLLLGHTEKNFVLDMDSREPEEAEANQFAAELLMPIEMLKKDFKNGKKDVKSLSIKYNVSEEAVWWRLYECRLITKI